MNRFNLSMSTALFCTTLFCTSMVSAQDAGKPTFTNIPGGLFIEWAAPVDVAAVQLGKGLTGSFELIYNVPSIDLISELIDKKPGPVTSPEMVTALADYWIARGKPERAIPLYENSLRRGNLDDTRTLIFQNNLAMLHSRILGQHEQVIGIINTALETKKDNVVLLDTKGLILMNNKQPGEAIPPLQQAVELSCQLPIYCLHLSYALHQENRDTQARRYFDPVRDQLIPAAPTMSKENKEMFDTLQSVLPPISTPQ